MSNWSLFTLFLSLYLLSSSTKILAQSPDLPVQVNELPTNQIPNPITPRKEPSVTPQLLPEERETPLETLPSSPQSPVPSTPGIPGTITITEFRFLDNTAFSDEELQQVVAPFLDRPLSFAQLLQLEEAITKLYIRAGYINSGAIIPANQTFAPQAAVVTIQIIEGGLEDIIVTGTKRLNSNYIRSRLAIASRRPFNQNKLLEALQLLQLDPLIQNISAELSAGARRESSLLEVRVIEADSFDFNAFINNGRVPSVGSFQRGVKVRERNLFGLGDRIEVTYTNTDGSDAVDTSYAIPFNASNGTVRVAGGFNNTEVIEPPFDDLDITGNSNYFEVTARQPIILSPVQELALGLTTSWQSSQTELLGEKFPLSRGANERGETKIAAIRFFQDWTQRNAREVYALRSQFSLGIDAFDATVNDDLPDSRFFAWRGQGQYVRLLAKDTLLVVRSDLQLSADELVPLEKFGVGGLGSVRGYRQDTLLTDNGFFASAEVRFPVFRTSAGEGVVQIVPFLDLGVGWNSGEVPDPAPNSLVGGGFWYQLANRGEI